MNDDATAEFGRVPGVANRPARLAVGVISAGRVGAVLGAALAAAGHDVVAAARCLAASAERAARLLPGVPLLARGRRRGGGPGGPRRARRHPAGAGRRPGRDRCAAGGPDRLHTSGAHGLAVLAPAERGRRAALALHPAMTFSGRAEDVDRLAAASSA